MVLLSVKSFQALSLTVNNKNYIKLIISLMIITIIINIMIYHDYYEKDSL